MSNIPSTSQRPWLSTMSIHKMPIAILWASMCFLSACGGSGGGNASDTSTPLAPTSYVDTVVYSSLPTASIPNAAEITVTTKNQLAINGRTINYTATTGHMTARNLTTNVAEASFFYVAYTADNATTAPATSRPITFFYNGGPGSSTVWLHLGSFGPKRLVTGDPATTAATPFPLVDNAESMLDVSDLVFVDAIGSGLSEAIAPNKNQTFWGVDADARVFRDFVMRYLAVNNRNASPKFLFGESYGTTRTAVLAHLLESAGVSLKGIVLQSSVLNYNSNCGVISTIISCAGYLPTYGAVGAWYNLANPNPTVAALPAFIEQSRVLATTQYDPAVQSFLQSKSPPSSALLTQLVNASGLSLTNWQTRFNVDPDYFQTRLIPGTLIGRYDARVFAPVGSVLASEGDPSSTLITSSYTTRIAEYLSTNLHYTNPSTYVLVSNAIQSWDFSHDSLPLPDTIPDLAAAMTLNPTLKTLSVNGYHDLATPFYVTEQDLARLGANSNVRLKFYGGGHMTYLDDAARIAEKADLVQFYQNALSAQ